MLDKVRLLEIAEPRYHFGRRAMITAAARRMRSSPPAHNPAANAGTIRIGTSATRKSVTAFLCDAVMGFKD